MFDSSYVSLKRSEILISWFISYFVYFRKRENCCECSSVSVSVILIGGGRILIVLTFSETPRLHSFKVPQDRDEEAEVRQ